MCLSGIPAAGEKECVHRVPADCVAYFFISGNITKDVCSWSILDVVYCRTSYTGEGGHWLFCPKSLHDCKPKVIKSPTILDTVFTPSKRVLEEMSQSPIILHILGKRFVGSWVEWAHVQHNPNISCLMPLHLTVCISYFPWRWCPSFYFTIFSSLVPHSVPLALA